MKFGLRIPLLHDSRASDPARLGEGWISDNMQMLDQVADVANRYRAYCAAEGREDSVCVVRNA